MVLIFTARTQVALPNEKFPELFTNQFTESMIEGETTRADGAVFEFCATPGEKRNEAIRAQRILREWCVGVRPVASSAPESFTSDTAKDAKEQLEKSVRAIETENGRFPRRRPPPRNRKP